MSGELTTLLSELKEAEALEFVKRTLAEGGDPMALLGQAREGMNIVGKRFAAGVWCVGRIRDAASPDRDSRNVRCGF